MNQYYNELSFKFDPVINTSVIFQQQVHQQKIDLKHINPTFVDLLAQLGLKIYFIECFRRDPMNLSVIHTDHYGEDEYVKINWIYGGKNSRMIWYKLKNSSAGAIQYTPGDTPYMFFSQGDVITDAQLVTENKPYLIQAGKPHRVVNPEEVRYCVCCLLSFANGESISMTEAQERLNEYIVTGAG